MSEYNLTLRNERIDAYHWLCKAAAARFIRPGLERSDLEQVATIGLIKAADLYDTAFGTPFSLFARQRILGELMHYVRDHETLVRFPRALHDIHRREQKAHVRLQAELGRDPSLAELATSLGCTKADVSALHEARYRCNIVDLDGIRDHASSSYDVDERALVLSSLRALDSDEKALLMGVYGLRLSQTEAGMRLGFTQRSASRLHKRALQKLSLALGEV